MAELDDLRREVETLRDQNRQLVDALIAAVTAEKQTVVTYPVPYTPPPAPAIPQWPPWQPYVNPYGTFCNA